MPRSFRSVYRIRSAMVSLLARTLACILLCTVATAASSDPSYEWYGWLDEGWVDYAAADESEWFDYGAADNEWFDYGAVDENGWVDYGTADESEWFDYGTADENEWFDYKDADDNDWFDYGAADDNEWFDDGAADDDGWFDDGAADDNGSVDYGDVDDNGSLEYGAVDDEGYVDYGGLADWRLDNGSFGDGAAADDGSVDYGAVDDDGSFDDRAADDNGSVDYGAADDNGSVDYGAVDDDNGSFDYGAANDNGSFDDGGGAGWGDCAVAEQPYAPYTSVTPQDLESAEHAVLYLVNLERANQGLDPLCWDDDLAGAAREHSQDWRGEERTCPLHPAGYSVACYHWDSRPGLEWPENRIEASNYPGPSAPRPENTYWGYGQSKASPAAAVDMWMNHDNAQNGHRDAILDPAATHVGVGVYTDGSGKAVFTLNFGVTTPDDWGVTVAAFPDHPFEGGGYPDTTVDGRVLFGDTAGDYPAVFADPELRMLMRGSPQVLVPAELFQTGGLEIKTFLPVGAWDVVVYKNSPSMITVAYDHSPDPNRSESPLLFEYYFIERENPKSRWNVGAPPTASGVLDGGKASWQDTGLEPNTEYGYQLCVVYVGEDTPECSGYKYPTTHPPGEPYTPPVLTPPTVIHVEHTSDSVTVSWGATGDYDRILVRIEDDLGNHDQRTVYNHPNRDFTFPGMRPEGQYTVLLKGCSLSWGALHCGPWSPPAVATRTSIAAPPPPQMTVEQLTLGHGMRYRNPVIKFDDEVRRLDFCWERGAGCGQKAAESFCYMMNPHTQYATSFERLNDVGPTRTMTHQRCDEPDCDSFAFITCNGYWDDSVVFGDPVVRDPAVVTAPSAVVDDVGVDTVLRYGVAAKP